MAVNGVGGTAGPSIDVSRVHSRHAARRAGDGALALVPAPGDVVRQAEASHDATRLRTALAALPEAQRVVITLAYDGGLTHVEIAEHLEVPFGTVKGRMRLGLEKLRLAFEPAESGEGEYANGKVPDHLVINPTSDAVPHDP